MNRARELIMLKYDQRQLSPRTRFLKLLLFLAAFFAAYRLRDYLALQPPASYLAQILVLLAFVYPIEFYFWRKYRDVSPTVGLPENERAAMKQFESDPDPESAAKLQKELDK